MVARHLRDCARCRWRLSLFSADEHELEAEPLASLAGFVSLWPVPDESTARLMTAFYRHWLAGVDKATALRQAQLEIMAVPGWEHPWWWAGFELVGA